MSFDALAPHYRWMEFILAGEKLQRCRTAFLDQVSQARNILIVGEGHGRCLVECCRIFQDAQIACVDASESMLFQARRRCAGRGLNANRVEFIQADALKWTPVSSGWDLIITNFFLDCFEAEQLERLISRLAAAAAPAANWLIADFQMAPAGWKRARSRLILWAMYVFFRVMTRLPAERLVAPDGFLERSGFALRQRAETEWGLLHSDWWERAG